MTVSFCAIAFSELYNHQSLDHQSIYMYVSGGGVFILETCLSSKYQALFFLLMRTQISNTIIQEIALVKIQILSVERRAATLQKEVQTCNLLDVDGECY